ncbi:MAG: hypothetical protein ACKO6B_12270 [Planctomycetia bacterium]
MSTHTSRAMPNSRTRFGGRQAAVMIVLALLVTTAAGGCGRSDMGRVSGVVTYKGAPVADAIVSFTPKNRPMAAGRTDAAGRFTLNTYSKGDGAVKGVNRVRIEPWSPGPEGFPEPGQMPAPIKEPERPDIPKKFRQEDTSGLTVEVIGGKRNEFSFELAE